MTDKEREMLLETHAMTKRLDDAFMKTSATGEPPLIERIGAVVILVERGNWSVKWGSRIVIGLGALVSAWTVVKATFPK